MRVLSYDVRAAAHDPGGARAGASRSTSAPAGPGHIDPRAQRRRRAEGARASTRTRPGKRRCSRSSTRIRGQRRRGAARGVPHLRRDVPLVGRGRRRAARPRQGRQERGRPGERADRRGRAGTRGSAASRRAARTDRRLRVVDNRLFDLIPDADRCPRGVHRPSATRRCGVGGPTGDAVTMIEFARDARGRHAARVRGEPPSRDRRPLPPDADPRPEARPRRGDRGWFEDRARVLTETYSDDARDQRLHLTSDYTLLGPLRFHLYRQVRRRAEALGRPARPARGQRARATRARRVGAGVARRPPDGPDR